MNSIDGADEVSAELAGARQPHSPGQLRAARFDFVGREHELATIATSLLGPTRLITLVGAGGIGKTTLAYEAVRRYRKARRVPFFWVPLARLSKGCDVNAVEEEFARAVVDTDFSGRSAWDALVETLDDRAGESRSGHAIVVVDNCEHVLSTAGQVIADLLDAVRGVKILATSRTPINWADERILSVPPFTGMQALAYFRRRAELAGQPITDREQIQLAMSVCSRVHNNPLYIRLATARLRQQPLGMLLRELTGEPGDRRLRWSDGPRLGTEQRHRRIVDVIAWSYDLCDANERLLFERLSIFAVGDDTASENDAGSADRAGADLEAIEMVCADTSSDGATEVVTRAEVADLLERLVDNSLVSRHLTPTSVRYSLVESLRVFAAERMRERSPTERERLATRHRNYYRAKIVRAQAEWFSPAEQELLRWGRAAWPNLLRAIDESLHSPETAIEGLQIAIGIVTIRLPILNGSLREARTLLERTLAVAQRSAHLPVSCQIEAKALMAWLSLMRGASTDAAQLLDECVALCLPESADRDQWRTRPEHDQGLPAWVELVHGGELLLTSGDARAVAALGRAREKFTAAGDLGGAAVSELTEALAAALLGAAAQSVGIARSCLDRATRAGAQWATSWARFVLALALTFHGDPREALTTGRLALRDHLRFDDRWGVLLGTHLRVWSLAKLIENTGAESRSGQRVEWATEIAHLIGSGIELRKRTPATHTHLGPFAAATDAATDAARSVLGKRFAAAEREGATLRRELHEAAYLALGDISLDPPPTTSSARDVPYTQFQELTAAEQQVAILAAAGWTNTAIAARRGSATKTVDAQIASIFGKLQINSRARIAALLPSEVRSQVTEEAARRPQRAANPPRTHDKRTV
ncbi:ATP-binding protein [Nocardia sp. NPDC049149]|uniref:ATP-binding protein n=1 Tax=Nocardia sp. NPDC049149 TaxID=3364315 RepID=UPI003719230B